MELSGTTPIIINGDIDSVEDGEKCITLSGANGVMIARPWISDPWLLRRFQDNQVPGKAEGREIFFREAAACGVPHGGMIELARMLWGKESERFRQFIAAQPD